MEFWIFIVIAVIGILLISIVAFVAKCFGYKKVMKKIRTLSMSSSQNGEDIEGQARSRHPASRPQDRSAVLPAPPAYAISFQHPVIARAPGAGAIVAAQPDEADSDARSATADHSSLELSTVSEAPFPEQPDAYSQLWSGAAFPGESVFVPPPYCIEPPAYSELSPEEGICAEGSMTAPSYAA